MAGYALGVLCLLLPLALLGAVFAGGVLMRRNRPADGVGVIVVGVLATVLGIVLLR